MSKRKSDSVNRCVFTQGTSLSDFIPIQFETTELEEVAPTRRRRTTTGRKCEI